MACCATVFAMCRSYRHYAAGTVLASQACGISSVSLASGSRAHDVEQAITPRGGLGGVGFDMVADPPTMLAPILDEDLVGVEPGGEHAGDVHARHVRLHRFGRVPRDAAALIHRHADRSAQREVGGV